MMTMMMQMTLLMMMMMIIIIMMIMMMMTMVMVMVPRIVKIVFLEAVAKMMTSSALTEHCIATERRSAICMDVDAKFHKKPTLRKIRTCDVVRTGHDPQSNNEESERNRYGIHKSYNRHSQQHSNNHKSHMPIH